MSKSVKPRSRRYRSTLRAEQAGLTRKRVLDAAAALFLERGYTGTTVAAVAASADVAPETIYASFSGKRGLLEGVIEEAITPEGVPHDASLVDVAALPTARERLRGFVRFCVDTLARTSPFHIVIRGAGDSEEFAVALRARLLAERLANNRRQLRGLIGDALRPGISAEQAAQRFCALTSPELHHLLLSELAWTRKSYEEWIATLAESELLTPEGTAPMARRRRKS
jgi:AcrR family transcriptional regulator